MQMYNPYYQPNMYNNPYSPYNAMANTQQRLQQMEQYPQYSQTSVLNGRIADTFDGIGANEIPMDNIGATFLKADGTEIMRKAWCNDGTIRTTIYKPQTELVAEDNSITLDTLNAKLDDISTKFEDILTKFKPKTAKREVNTDE